MTPSGPPGTRPNLLYILSDQHAPSVVGCYGNPVVETPNLDHLAAHGVVFEHVYCPSPICVPSRMAFLTGRHPCEIKVWKNDHILDSAKPTLAHAMGAAGYRPVLIGRMHARGPDQLHGYVERLVGDHSPNHPGGTPVDHGMLAGTQEPLRVSLEKSGHGQSAYQVHDEDVTAAAVEYLNRVGVERRAGRRPEPFCLSVGFMLPHQPFVARREDYDRYLGRVGLPAHPEPYTNGLHPFFRWWRSQCGIESVSDEEVLRARTAYYGLVHRLDVMVGQLLTALVENALDHDTIVCYLSDHGEQLGEHGLWWKHTFYENSVTVPAILSWPGMLPQGVRCPRVASSLDLNTTLLAALGAPPLPRSRGRSLLPVVRGESSAWEDVAASEYCALPGRFHRMIRRGSWKLNYYHGQEPQLFDLNEDPNELLDRAQDPGCREIRAALVDEALREWDPREIAEEIDAIDRDVAVHRAWAQRAAPPDHYRWPLRPEMDFLDDG